MRRGFFKQCNLNLILILCYIKPWNDSLGQNMMQPSLLEFAKQGNVKVLASLMNSLLKAHGMMADLSKEDDCLQILIESDRRSLTEEFRTPNRTALVSMIQKWLITIGVENISKVQVSWQRTGQDCPTWTEEFELVVPMQPDLAQKIAVYTKKSETNPEINSASLTQDLDRSELDQIPELKPPFGFENAEDLSQDRDSPSLDLSPRSTSALATKSHKSGKHQVIVTLAQYLVAAIAIVGIVAAVHYVFAHPKSAKETAESSIQSIDRT